MPKEYAPHAAPQPLAAALQDGLRRQGLLAEGLREGGHPESRHNGRMITVFYVFYKLAIGSPRGMQTEQQGRTAPLYFLI